MGNRVPYAMRTLAGQVLARHPLSTVSYEDADGIGVFRTLVIGGDATQWFVPVMEAIAIDERIDFWRFGENDLEITFVGDRRADDGKPFPLREIQNTIDRLNAEDTERDRLGSMKVEDLRKQYPASTKGLRKKSEMVDAILAAQ